MDFSKLPAILTPDLGLLFWMLLAFAVVFFRARQVRLPRHHRYGRGAQEVHRREP